jgi:hypothetical protein
VTPADGMGPMGLGRIDTPGDRIARFYLHLEAHRVNQRVNGGTGHSVAASTRMARADAARARRDYRNLVIGRRRLP